MQPDLWVRLWNFVRRDFDKKPSSPWPFEYRCRNDEYALPWHF
jgi:hypothetical protein